MAAVPLAVAGAGECASKPGTQLSQACQISAAAWLALGFQAYARGLEQVNGTAPTTSTI